MGKKHTSDEVDDIISNIRELIYKRWTDDQIRKEYGSDGRPMPVSTYYYYLKKMQEEDRKILEKYNPDKVPTEVNNLIKMFDEVIAWCEKHKDDDIEPLKDRIAVQNLKMQIQAGKIQLLLQGPSIINKLMKSLQPIINEPDKLILPWDSVKT